MKHINSNKSDAKKEYKNHIHQQKVDLKLMDVIIFFYNQTNVAYFFLEKRLISNKGLEVFICQFQRTCQLLYGLNIIEDPII